jgi:dienelactone hydrolase
MKMKRLNKRFEEATIPVEHIRCPLLIISGDDDKMWPSSVAGNSIIERLDTKGSTIIKKHVHYPHAGHNFLLRSFPYGPSLDVPALIGAGRWCWLGGTTEGNAHANKEAWQEMLNFLRTTIGNK